MRIVKEEEEKIDLFKIDLRNIVAYFRWTEYYEEYLLVCVVKGANFYVMEGYHCSCYDFFSDVDLAFDCIFYTIEEMYKLATKRAKDNNDFEAVFYRQVCDYFNDNYNEQYLKKLLEGGNA